MNLYARIEYLFWFCFTSLLLLLLLLFLGSDWTTICVAGLSGQQQE